MQFDCRCDRVLPDVIFWIGGKEFRVSSEEYVIPTGMLGLCTSGIIGGEDEKWIFGTLFLRTVYSVYDIRRGMIGFAKV